MVIAALFLVLLNATIEFVCKAVNGGVHVGLHIVGMDGAAADVQRRLRRLSELLHRQHTMHIDDMIEMAHDSFEFFLHIGAQRGGDFDVMTGDAQMNSSSPAWFWSNLFEARAAPLVGRRNAHGLAVLCNGAAGNRDPLA